MQHRPGTSAPPTPEQRAQFSGSRSRQLSSCILAALLLASAVTARAATVASQQDEVVSSGPVPARPENKKSRQLETVTVKAGRSGDPQTTNTSSAVITGSDLERNRVMSLVDLQQLVPGLTVNSVDAFNTSISIRGIGDGGGETSGDVNVGMPSSVVLYQDNVYLSRAGMMSPYLDDIDNLQVLSGAQGTLFAANATAGVVDVHTAAPDSTPSGEVKVGLGSLGYAYTKAMFNGPLSRYWNGRVDLYQARNNGDIRNVYNGSTLNGSFGSGIRAQAAYSRSDFFNLRLIADYSTVNARPTGVLVATHAVDGVDSFLTHAATLGVSPLVSSRSVDTDTETETRTRQGGFSAEANWNFASGYHLRSVSAWRFFDYNPTTGDILDVPIYADAGTRVTDRTWSESLRLDSPHGDIFDYAAGIDFYYEKLRTIANAYYGDDANSWYGSSAYNGIDIIRYGLLNEARWSGFLQGTFHLSQSLDLTIGGRGTYDRKGASFIRYNKANFNSGYLQQDSTLPAGTAALNYHINPTTLAYLAVSYGQKSGAVNVSAGAAKVAGTSSLFLKPETTKSAELGIKGTADHQKLNFKADLFLTKVSDFQTQGYDPVSQEDYLLNAGSFRSRGAEGSLQWRPDTHWNLNIGAVYNDETYLNYADALCPPEVTLAANPPSTCNLTGHRVFNAPRFSGNLGARYTWHTTGNYDVYIGGNYAYRSWMYGTVDDSKFTRVPGYGLLGLSAGLTEQLGRGSLDVSLFANNALNKTYYTRLIKSDYGAVIGYIGQVRMVGINVDYNF
ncbi:TonB-dependent receptor [Frateuria aurantia]